MMLSLERAVMEGGERLAGHGHAAPHLLIVSSGSLMQRDSSGLRDLSTGSFRLSPARARHDLCFGSDGAVCLILEGEGPFWRRVFSRALSGKSSRFGVTDGAALISTAPSGAHADFSRQHIVALGKALVTASGGRPLPDAPVWMDEALDLLDGDALAGIKQVADTLRRDRIHFTRAFGAWIGFRPVEYRAMRRAAAARDLIRTTDARLAEIALACGYAHQSHMNRAFRTMYGCSPSHWRA